MIKILICGDSFAVDTAKYKKIPYKGWPNLMAECYDVTNVAQAGVGQYKIWKQLERSDLNQFEKIIVSISSPNRVHCKKHPIHGAGLHEQCDLIVNDISRPSFFNSELTTIKNWFKFYFDQPYQSDLYDLITEKIISLIASHDHLIIGHNQNRLKIDDKKNFIDFSTLWSYSRGDVNHYTEQANFEIFETIRARL